MVHLRSILDIKAVSLHLIRCDEWWEQSHWYWMSYLVMES